MFDQAVHWGWLVLPHFLYDTEKASGLPSKQQFEWGEAGGNLGYILDSKKHIQDQEVSVAPIFRHHSS